jgi:AmmeMemoRadiSam system protein A
MAVAAALSDPRFETLAPDELRDLRIEISILSSLREIRTPQEISVGQHGLVVRKGPRSGLLLPQVARERGWSPLEFLGHTCEKAGLPHDAWQDESTKIFVFSAKVFGEERELTH